MLADPNDSPKLEPLSTSMWSVSRNRCSARYASIHPIAGFEKRRYRECEDLEISSDVGARMS